MIRIAEVDTAIARGTTRVLERAFESLITWSPQSAAIEGSDPDVLASLLSRVATALLEDESYIPYPVLIALEWQHTGQRFGSDYRSAARFVLSRLDEYRAGFDRWRVKDE